MKRKTKLIREQLDKTLRKFEPLRDSTPPVKGWIRAIRDALGMNGRQLADRLGEHRSRTKQIEEQEITGSLTFNTIRKIAEALDCVFVYGLVPRTSLEETVSDQAKQIALERLARASHTMKLENQALSEKENSAILFDMIREIIDELPSNLWDV
ncbi:MAG: mobile mystery protein A [Candidatus Aegiribacteria sp.]|nr:mobile mystery protein A [Candidatus Aegiribacteria sp.]